MLVLSTRDEACPQDLEASTMSSSDIGTDGARTRAPRVVVMGVTGCGKTTAGAALAQRLRVPFADADDFHPEANVTKMAAGIPLGFFGVPMAYAVARLGESRDRARIGLALVGVSLVAFVGLLFAMG